MRKSLISFAKWICRQLTENDFASLMVILLEVLSGKHSDFKFRQPKPTPNYRDFRQDDEEPLYKPVETDNVPKYDWRELRKKYQKDHNKPLKPVVSRNGVTIPDHTRCRHCAAPHTFLYSNDGKRATQYRCKVCGEFGQVAPGRRKAEHGLYCPHCSYQLYMWKENVSETIYKCSNKTCPHYLRNKAKLNNDETAKRNANKYNPNYKLRYQYRVYHIDREKIKCLRPENNETVAIDRIHNSNHVLGLVLALTINLGLSSRQVRNALFGFWGIEISHQTVLNYVKGTAAAISKWLDHKMPVPAGPAAADETYIRINGKWHYTWFVIDSHNRSICGYNLSTSRKKEAALATLHNAYGEPDGDSCETHILVRDALGSYDSAINMYNQQAIEAGRENEKPAIIGKTVTGLENKDEVSKQYRPFKQLVERLNRTYKFHTRPRNGFKDIDGATALTTLFVAYYNYLRPNSSEILQGKAPIQIPELSNDLAFPKQWEKLIELAAS